MPSLSDRTKCSVSKITQHKHSSVFYWFIFLHFFSLSAFSDSQSPLQVSLFIAAAIPHATRADAVEDSLEVDKRKQCTQQI